MSASGDMHPRTLAETERFRAEWPDEFRDGARCAFLRKYPGAREAGGYPSGFHKWPLDRRNAWWAGNNRGACDRLELQKKAGNGGA
ncbi:hypothetical protein M2322_000625 [Rhodoblastus acidophilus]|uniref:hypothetical protein n=1 Tax=Rhodoblastus acidophilus TaxID=1074 RepID=UPI00222502CB|nr:hypothetical protein [Rhodoblastus acidophilus]MCW2315105.1 hypothetical protein [Rhodoblastus acidophilus]